MGSNKKPFFRVIAADERTSTVGRFIENLGWYDPKKKHGNFELNMERVRYWIDNGARQTVSVKSLVKKAGDGAQTEPPAEAPPPEPALAAEEAPEETDTPAAEPEAATEETPAEEEKPAAAEA